MPRGVDRAAYGWAVRPEQAAVAQQLNDARDKIVGEIAAFFSVLRSTVYGHLTVNTKAPGA